MRYTEAISPSSTRLGWIGTGVMGRSMASHLLASGYQLSVFNRTQSKAQPLIEKGAKWANSPREVAENSDIVFSMVGFPSDVRQTILADDGVLSGLSPGGVAVDMTTSEPNLAKEIAAEAETRQMVALDAPVSGGDIGAREARLSIMVGGDEHHFHLLKPLWECMGKTIVHQGGPGSGQHCKMANQILVGGIMISLCEALLYAARSGNNVDHVLQAVSSGAASSWSLVNLAPRIQKNDYAPGFFVEHFVKDLGIALLECERMNLQLPGLKLAHELYQRLEQEGDGRLGTQALIRSLRRMNGLGVN